VLVFVHAGMWSYIWRDVIRDLRTDFRCIALDFPGSGLSEQHARYEVGISAHAEVLDQFVRLLRLDKLTLVLHDLGGPIGLTFASRQPARIRALVIAQSFGWWPRQRLLQTMIGLMGGPAMRALNVRTNLIPRLTATSFGVGRHLDRHARRAFLGPTQDRRGRLAFHDLMRDARNSRPVLEAIEESLRGPLADRPLLTIFGEHNDPLQFQQDWRRLFPHARQVVIPRGNHFPMNDDPAMFAASIRNWWINSVGLDPGGHPAEVSRAPQAH
jgi:pimeloyl-ACP methyl ester carboxylesterase